MCCGVEKSRVEREREKEKEREEKRREEKRSDKTRPDQTRLEVGWLGGPVGAEDGRIVGDWADAGMSG
jgi:hypothetical protein